MLSLATGDYTAAQVTAALHAAVRQESFRYELLDGSNLYQSDISDYINLEGGGSVANNALAQIKRIARLSIKDDGLINFLSDRIKPYYRLKMSDGGWAEFALGVFLLSTPPRQVDITGTIMREVEAYDQLQVLVDDKVDERYTIAAGTNYITAVSTLLTGAGITSQNLTPTDKTLPTAKDWEPGTSKLTIINALLTSINYRSLFFDENGVAIAQPYVSPSDRASEYTYATNSTSVILPDAVDELDLFDIPNKVVLTVSESDRAVLTGTYTNSNADSPTSTVSRGRTIVHFESVDAVDQATLDDMAERKLYDKSQLYQKVPFNTALMPHHSEADVLTLQYTDLGIDAKFSETSWEMELKPGGRHRHNVRKIVTI